MKKRIFLAVFLAVAMTFSACSGEGKSAKEERNETETAKQETNDDENVILLRVKAEKISKDEASVIKTVLRSRLDSMGYTDCNVSVSKKGIVKIDGKCRVEDSDVKNLIKTASVRFFTQNEFDENGDMLSEAKPVIDGNDIEDAYASYGKISDAEGASNFVNICFTEEGQRKFFEATKKNVGQAIYIMLDDEIISAPTVQSPIDSDVCVISGEFSKSEAENLAITIKSGSLPYELELYSPEK